MNSPVRVLHLEDNPTDAGLVKAMLAEDGLACEIVRVETRIDFAAALDRNRFDLIISDFTLPSYDGRSALLLAREKRPDTPVLFFSGTLGEESAIQALKDGATDYVLKQRPARFISAVRRALREAEEGAARKRMEDKLHESQVRLQALLDNSPTMIFLKDTEGRYLLSNRQFEEITHRSSKEIVGKTDAELFPPEQAAAFRANDLKVLQDGVVLKFEEVALHDDGPHTSIVYKFPLRDATGKIYAIGGIVTDITERKQLEDQLRQAQKMEAIGQLTGGIAHDFNNMLTIIMGYSEMMLRSLKPDNPLRSDVEQVRPAGERASSLTRQLLAFSRKQVLQPRVLDLNAVLTNLDRMLQRLIGEDIDLVTVLVQGLWHVNADPGQIEQVIVNLAVNARDAMLEGGKLTIETANVELDDTYAREHVSVRPGSYVMLAVSDTGCGMDKETQARIFEPFFTTKEQGKGTGLGLSTVYGIVKQSGGYIWVYSEVGRGTAFKIYLPRVEGAVETVEPGATHIRTIRGSETILLVEDDNGVRTLIRSTLQAHGYTVLEARHSKEAFLLSGQHEGPIHLVVTDMVMPGMSGRDLAECLNPLRPNMKVLFMSGYTDKAIHRHGMLDPGTAFLQKPFTPDSLMRKVREVLDVPGNRNRS